MNKEADYLGHRKRLKERFVSFPSSLPDYELLELMLSLAIPRKDTKPLAKLLLKDFGGIPQILNAPADKLMQYLGLKENTIFVFELFKEVGIRNTWSKLEDSDMPIMSTWDDLISYCSTTIGYSEVENFYIVFLNAKNRVIGKEIQQRGTIDCVAIHPSEVVRSVISKNAKSIILVHNHPSGDVTPSSADIMVTNKINDALKSIDVTLLDHLIISKTMVYSFSEHNLIKK